MFVEKQLLDGYTEMLATWRVRPQLSHTSPITTHQLTQLHLYRFALIELALDDFDLVSFLLIDLT